MDEAQFVEWVDQHQQVNEAPFILLIDQYQQAIGKICRLYKDQSEKRDSLYREIILQLWKSALADIEKVRSGSWIYRIALSTAITSNIFNSSKTTTAPKGRQIHTNHKEQLINALKQLTDSDKAIITLYLEDLSYADIAAITGLAETVIGVKLNRIKKKVQQQLTATNEPLKLKAIWQNIDALPKSSVELIDIISNRPSSFFNIPNILTPSVLSKAIEKGCDIKKCLEEAPAKIKSAALFSISSRTIIIGCVLLLAWFIIPANTAKFWIMTSALLLFVIQITLLSRTWLKRIAQMRFTYNHFRSQREFYKKHPAD